jgi:hypothetical protein
MVDLFFDGYVDTSITVAYSDDSESHGVIPLILPHHLQGSVHCYLVHTHSCRYHHGSLNDEGLS